MQTKTKTMSGVECEEASGDFLSPSKVKAGEGNLECPSGHGKLKLWEGESRCWECGWTVAKAKFEAKARAKVESEARRLKENRIEILRQVSEKSFGQILSVLWLHSENGNSSVLKILRLLSVNSRGGILDIIPKVALRNKINNNHNGWMDLVLAGKAEYVLPEITALMCVRPSLECLDAWSVVADHCVEAVVTKSKNELVDRLFGQDWAIAVEMLYHCQYQIENTASQELVEKVDLVSRDLSYPMAISRYLLLRSGFVIGVSDLNIKMFRKIFPQSTFFEWEDVSSVEHYNSVFDFDGKGRAHFFRVCRNDSGLLSKAEEYFDYLKDLNPLRGMFIRTRYFFELYRKARRNQSINNYFFEQYGIISPHHNEITQVTDRFTYKCLDRLMRWNICYEGYNNGDECDARLAGYNDLLTITVDHILWGGLEFQCAEKLMANAEKFPGSLIAGDHILDKCINFLKIRTRC